MTNELLIDLERQLLNTENRKNTILLNRLIHDEFEEYGASGQIYCKSDILKRLPLETPQTIEAFDFAIKTLAPTLQQVKFKTLNKNLESQKLFTLRSSIWILTDNQWQMIFHQGTHITYP